MRKAMTLLVPAAAALSGCVSGARETPVVIAQPPEAFRAPQVMRESGLESVIGEGAASLSRRFGEARIDLKEGDARKLQFASADCVLDIFLYPLREGGAPVATHVEARLRQGGAPAPRERCIDEIERAR